jgi:glutamine amidotransferase
MNNKKVVIIDYGAGNLYSVQRALEVCGATDIIISNAPSDIIKADRIVLPGVGAFSDGIRGLSDAGLDDAIREFVNTGRPLLGICLGMQLLATVSEEFGENYGLNLIPGIVTKIPYTDVYGNHLKIPLIGWRNIYIPQNATWSNSLLKSFTGKRSVFFVHSFHFIPNNKSELLAVYERGGRCITAAISKDNIYGLQFHPEKSGGAGLEILAEYLTM